MADETDRSPSSDSLRGTLEVLDEYRNLTMDMDDPPPFPLSTRKAMEMAESVIALRAELSDTRDKLATSESALSMALSALTGVRDALGDDRVGVHEVEGPVREMVAKLAAAEAACGLACGELVWIAVMVDDHCPQEVIDHCCDGRGVAREDYEGECDPTRNRKEYERALATAERDNAEAREIIGSHRADVAKLDEAAAALKEALRVAEVHRSNGQHVGAELVRQGDEHEVAIAAAQAREAALWPLALAVVKMMDADNEDNATHLAAQLDMSVALTPSARAILAAPTDDTALRAMVEQAVRMGMSCGGSRANAGLDFVAELDCEDIVRRILGESEGGK